LVDDGCLAALRGSRTACAPRKQRSKTDRSIEMAAEPVQICTGPINRPIGWSSDKKRNLRPAVKTPGFAKNPFRGAFFARGPVDSSLTCSAASQSTPRVAYSSVAAQPRHITRARARNARPAADFDPWDPRACWRNCAAPRGRQARGRQRRTATPRSRRGARFGGAGRRFTHSAPGRLGRGRSQPLTDPGRRYQHQNQQNG